MSITTTTIITVLIMTLVIMIMSKVKQSHNTPMEVQGARCITPTYS
jgi:hypothetical protein